MARQGLAQRAMQNPVLATVYERAWRPALGFAFMGFDLDHVRHEKALTVRALKLAPGKSVLDVACGPGNFTAEFAKAVGPTGRAIGIDLSEPMLARARRDNSGTGATYVLGDATDLPSEDASFDAVNCYAALYLIPNPFAVVDEMIRVVRPGGRLAIMASLASDNRRFRALQARALGVAGLRMFDRNEFTDVLRSRGFTDIEQEIHGLAQYVSATAPDGPPGADRGYS